MDLHGVCVCVEDIGLGGSVMYMCQSTDASSLCDSKLSTIHKYNSLVQHTYFKTYPLDPISVLFLLPIVSRARLTSTLAISKPWACDMSRTSGAVCDGCADGCASTQLRCA